MSRAAGTSPRGPAVLPPGLVVAMRRGLRRLAGALLLAFAVALAVALAGWQPTDPSFNVATGAAPRNPLGLPGAMTADLLLQMFGAAPLLLPLVFGVWGIRLVTGRPVRRFALRLAALPLVVIFTALALAAAPTPAAWPLPVGSGGFAGGLMLDGSLHLLTLVGAGGTGATIPSALGGLLALILLLPLLSMAPAEWLALGRGAWRLPWRSLRGLRSLRGPRGLPGLARAAGLLRRGSRARVEPVLGRDPVAVLPDPAEVAPDQPAPPPPKFLVEPRSDGDGGAPKPAAGRQRSLDLGRNGGYRLPGLEHLEPAPAGKDNPADSGSLAQNARLLESVLADFGVNGEVVKVRPGPVVTLYELVPAPGTKSSRVIGLSDDLARSMSAVSVRVAVIPGRNVIGIELPNARRETVFLREILESRAYGRTAARLPLVLGKDIGGGPVIVDLARMPHLLIAGTTGSGKSVSINTLILSLLYRLRPEECRFIMIDPKMLELSVYDGIPHLLAPVVTEPARAVVALKWVVREMEGRYQSIARLGVRNIEGYNSRIAEARRQGEVLRRRVQTGFDTETGLPVYEEQPLDLEPLPWIVVIVDEMADLMMVAGKDIEAAVQRLAQMARAAGIHLIMATQRPSVDVITGTIKANFPTRISFQVTSRIDSRTILGEQGAETLLGQGDMLYMAGGGRITRVHGPFVGDSEVEDVVRHLKSQGSPAYIEAITEDGDAGGPMLPGVNGSGDDGDGLYRQAVGLVIREGKASTSFVQRHLQIGYNRAARLIDRMEAEGIISQANHVGKREILLGRDH